MRILLSNDDGVMAPGIRALANALREVGEVFVVAPDGERSATSHSITVHDPIRVDAVNIGSCSRHRSWRADRVFVSDVHVFKKYLCKNRNLIAEKRRKILIFAKICRARKRVTLTKCKQKELCVIDQHPLHI